MNDSIVEVKESFEAIKNELSRVVVGQEEVIENVLIALFAGGHVLLEGVPGLGKTLLVSALSRILGADYKRIQFTPDLMPSDIIGTTVYNTENNSFSVKKGPVFCNLLLSDEINRSPAKTQSALLQAMQEKSVSIDGTDYPLEDFFICLATQNPVEMEGTYPLPEAQVDRFFMKVLIDYPSLDDERKMLFNYRTGFSADRLETADLNCVLQKSDIVRIQKALEAVETDDKIIHYITDLVSVTRKYNGIEIGASPRGCVDLFKACRVMAVINGRDYVIPDDVKEMALPVLRHRIIPSVEAEIDGSDSDAFLRRILDEVEVPR